VPKLNLIIDNITSVIALKSLWLRANRGVLKEVAKQLKVTPQMVSAVYHGHRRSQRVETALRRKGAPVGAKRRKQAA
jgi:hypothetical protein